MSNHRADLGYETERLTPQERCMREVARVCAEARRRNAERKPPPPEPEPEIDWNAVEDDGLRRLTNNQPPRASEGEERR